LHTTARLHGRARARTFSLRRAPQAPVASLVSEWATAASRRRALTALIALVAAAAGCAGDGGDTGTPDVDEELAMTVDSLADAYVAAYFERNPESATSEGIEGADHAGVVDNSLQGLAAWHAREDALLAGLDAVDAPPAGSAARLTYDFLRETLEASIGRRVCRMQLWNVSPTYTGWQANYAFTATIQPVGTPDGREAALARAAELDRFIDTETVNLREGLARGYSAPRTNVRSVIEQLDALLATPVEDAPFYAPAQRDSTREFGQRLAALIRDEIYPAIARHRDFLRDEYLPAAREAIAVAANPDGEACYRASVRYHTSLQVPPREIHETGLAQIEKIRTEMQQIGERSFGTSDVKALLEMMKSDPRYTFDSRDHMLEYAQAAVERAKDAVPQWFGLVPKADVIVTPYPAFQEKSAPGGEYNAPSDDLSRPGVYRINLYEADKSSIAGLESTAFHETYPGHHLQIAIAKERTDTHPIQKYFGTSGFIEGWGLYAERLSDEMGLFTGDVDRMGLLSNEALRAARLVVDAGMHALGWSRQQAIDYLLANTAESSARATAEIDRYIAVPGQATAYMLGNLEIRRLRAQSEEALGRDFDIKAFHDAVVEDGGVTLAMLRDKIARWLAAGSGG